jgi:hypothetical protein
MIRRRRSSWTGARYEVRNTERIVQLFGSRNLAGCDAVSARVGAFNFVEESAPLRHADVLIVERCTGRMDVRGPALPERLPWAFYLEGPLHAGFRFPLKCNGTSLEFFDRSDLGIRRRIAVDHRGFRHSKMRRNTSCGSSPIASARRISSETVTACSSSSTPSDLWSPNVRAGRRMVKTCQPLARASAVLRTHESRAVVGLALVCCGSSSV